MKKRDDGSHEDAIMNTSPKNKFSEFFDELEKYAEDEQMQKIEKMKRMIDFMNEEDFESVYAEELFNKIFKMIEEEKMSIESAILILKHIGYLTMLRGIYVHGFAKSSLDERFKKMIIKEYKSKERMNEKLLVDLCECHISLGCYFNPKMFSIFVSCLLKAAMNKEESEEIKKEVEMALLTLSCIDMHCEIKKELYFKEMAEIIKYNQEHGNLTRVAYLSAWEFLIKRLHSDKNLSWLIEDKLHFTKEATRELLESMKRMDWTNKEGEMKGIKEVEFLKKWLFFAYEYFSYYEIWKEEHVEVIRCIVTMYRTTKDNNREIGDCCIEWLMNAAYNRAVKIDRLLEEGVLGHILKKMHQQTLNKEMIFENLRFFIEISSRLKEKKKDEIEEMKRKELKKEMFEKMEEEGFEDIISSFHERLGFLNKKYYFDDALSLNISDCFMNI